MNITAWIPYDLQSQSTAELLQFLEEGLSLDRSFLGSSTSPSKCVRSSGSGFSFGATLISPQLGTLGTKVPGSPPPLVEPSNSRTPRLQITSHDHLLA